MLSPHHVAFVLKFSKYYILRKLEHRYIANKTRNIRKEWYWSAFAYPCLLCKATLLLIASVWVSYLSYIPSKVHAAFCITVCGLSVCLLKFFPHKRIKRTNNGEICWTKKSYFDFLHYFLWNIPHCSNSWVGYDYKCT